jgi:hypothetical protein
MPRAKGENVKRGLVVVTIFVMVFLVACGGEEGWGAEAREEFIAGCESGGASNEVCTCMAEKAEARFPDAEGPDDFAQDEVAKIAQECVAESEK